MLGIVVATTRAKAMAAAAKISMKDVGSHSGDVILTIEQAIAAGGERVKMGPVKGRDMAKGCYQKSWSTQSQLIFLLQLLTLTRS
jgi:hypothetical protein